MSRKVSKRMMLTQMMRSFVVCVIIYMIYALSGYQGGIDGVVGIFVFHPLMAMMLSSLTVICCLVLGLPIWFCEKVNIWWTNRSYIPIVLICIGIGLMLLSHMYKAEFNWLDNGREKIEYIPNIYLFVTGWFLISFSTLYGFSKK